MSAVSRSGTVTARAPSLLRLAHQMVGDPGAAADLVARVVSRQRMRRALAGADDEVVVAALVRAALHTRAEVTDGTRLAALPRRERIAIVLAFAVGWDATGIAEAMGTTPRRVLADVRRGLAVAPEQEWRRLLADDGWDIVSGADIDRRSVTAARRRRSHRRAGLLAAGAALTLVVGVIDLAVRVVTAPPPPPPTANVDGLLPWPARGPLIRDTRFIHAATSLWSRSPRAPRGRIYVLYAGRVGAGRLAVLQAIGPDRQPQIAVVADHDVTFNNPRLKLDLVEPLPRTDLPVLLVPYDGNLEIPGLTSGPGSRVLQALVAPNIDAVDERSSRAPASQAPRPGFSQQSLRDGLSEPWLDLSGSVPDTAVRAYRHGLVVFTGLVAPTALVPRPASGAQTAPPAAWRGLPAALDPDVLNDDILWWEETCHDPATPVSLVWVGRARAVTSSIRLELVQCAGHRVSARWVDGGGQGARWIGTTSREADAYAVLVLPDSVAPATVVAVGSTEVSAVDIGGVRTRGRVGQETARGGLVPPVAVHGEGGARLRVAFAPLPSPPAGGFVLTPPPQEQAG